MTVQDIQLMVGAILGSNLLTGIILSRMQKKKTRAETSKLDQESHQISQKNEMDLFNFYKIELAAAIQANKDLMEAHKACESRLDALEIKYNNLQREFTLLKVETLRKRVGPKYNNGSEDPSKTNLAP